MWQRQQSESESRLVVFDSLWPHGLYSLLNFPGQNTGVANLSLIFPTQGSNPVLLHCRQILYRLSHKRSPAILKWVVYPFSSRSSWPRNWTRVSCIAGGFFTNWANRETQRQHSQPLRLKLLMASLALKPQLSLKLKRYWLTPAVTLVYS